MGAKRVLIVDDALIMRKRVAAIAEEAGWQVAGEAQNGLEAVELFRQERPDLVTLDIVMPQMDGVAALRQMIQDDPQARVVMVSAVNQKAKLAECIQAGAIDFIVKPFEKSDGDLLRQVPGRRYPESGYASVKSGPTRILVVDDSALYRQSIHNVLREMADITVVGTANNGVEALEKIEQLEPDLLTLDVQMPDMDGIEVLREIKRRRLRPKAIMVSSLTSQGAQATTDALMEGAFDFILKPSSRDVQANRQQLRRCPRTENRRLPRFVTTPDANASPDSRPAPHLARRRH